MKPGFRDYMFRVWYWYVNKKDKHAEILFMNYGYSSNEQIIELDKAYETDRYSIQLYEHLATEADITGKDILEVGSGRGGGLTYITKKYKPSHALGIDLDKIAIKFSNSHYKLDNLSFQQGDALDLQVKKNSKDIIFNVESSHRYTDMNAFLSCVKKILKPGGYFLFTDFRYDYEMDELNEQLKSSGLKIIKEKMITQQIVEALTKDDKRKRELVDKLVPGLLKKTALNFAGTIGSETYNQFDERKYIYFSYIIQNQ